MALVLPTPPPGTRAQSSGRPAFPGSRVWMEPGEHYAPQWGRSAGDLGLSEPRGSSLGGADDDSACFPTVSREGQRHTGGVCKAQMSSAGKRVCGAKSPVGGPARRKRVLSVAAAALWGRSVLLSGHLPDPQKEGAWPTAAASVPPAHPLAYLSGVVEAFGLDVVSLLVHHLHLGVQVPAQVLGSRSEEEGGPWASSLPLSSGPGPEPSPPLWDLSSEGQRTSPSLHPPRLSPRVFLSECFCFL